MPEILTNEHSSLDDIRQTSGSIVLFAALLAFFLVMAGFGGIKVLTRAQTNTREELKSEIAQKEADIRPDLLGQISILEKRLTNMRTLLDIHVFNSNVFRMIEADTHPQVRFSNFSFISQPRKLDMSGEAASHTVIAQQIAILEREPHIERVEFGSLGVGRENLITFKLSLILKPSILDIQPNP